MTQRQEVLQAHGQQSLFGSLFISALSQTDHG